MDIRHCSTDDMVADFFSKSLQGKKLTRFRAIVLGLKEAADQAQVEHRSVLQLHVLVRVQSKSQKVVSNAPRRHYNCRTRVIRYFTHSGSLLSESAKSVMSYVPHMDARRKYDEVSGLTVGGELIYSTYMGSVVAYVLQ